MADRADADRGGAALAGVQLADPAWLGHSVRLAAADWALPGWTLTPLWVLTVAVVGALGYVGRQIDKPLIQRATAPGGIEPLRPTIVIEVLCSLGNAKMVKPEQIRLLSDVAREGRDYRIELELPQGATANFVMDKRAELAIAIRRELGCVWP
ncbi:MAG: hypothetical protein ACRDTA_07515 [Pseudonocardiaceae bacterium]